MKLYVMPGACSMVPHTALEWSKVSYDLELVSLAETKTPEYLALNPQGAVPLLVDGDFVLSQNVAILEYLNALYPNARIFGNGDAKSIANVWHWLAYFNADVHKSFAPIFHVENFLSDANAQKALQENAHERIVKQMDYPNKALANQDYLTGDQITIADVYLYVLLRWAKGMKIDLTQYQNLDPFFARVESNQGVQVVIVQEKIKNMA